MACIPYVSEFNKCIKIKYKAADMHMTFEKNDVPGSSSRKLRILFGTSTNCSEHSQLVGCYPSSSECANYNNGLLPSKIKGKNLTYHWIKIHIIACCTNKFKRFLIK